MASNWLLPAPLDCRCQNTKLFMSPDSEKLLNALRKGIVRGIGGTIYDVKMSYLMSNTDMYYAVRELESIGVIVERLDSGGSPRWRLWLDN